MSTSSHYPRSVQITVHLDAVAHNYQTLQQLSGGKTFAVVKADAYGHGIDAVASYLSTIADGFAVVTVGEGVAVRDAGATQPVLVMQGPQDEEDVDTLFQHGLWPVLHDEAQIELVQRHRNAIDIEVWLEVETGMGRLGISLESAVTHLQNDQLRWQGVMSHLASADDTDNPMTANQVSQLIELKNRFNLPFSLANSAGVLAWPATHLDWSRVGIGLYGSHPVLMNQDPESLLRTTMSVQAPIVSVKSLPAGQTIGYGETYRCPEPMSVAYAAVGYGDGLPRVLDDSARVLIHGVQCPIIGRVSMDSIAIDCRPLQVLPTLGELITLWGPELKVEQWAAAAGTISYELFTGIRGRRKYTD